MQNKKKTVAIYVGIIIILFIGLWFMTTLIKPAGVVYKYSDIIYMFEDGAVKEFSLDLGTGELRIKLDMANEKAAKITPSATDKEGNKFVIYRVAAPSLFVEDSKAAIQKYNVEQVEGKMNYEYIPAKDKSWLFPMISLVLTLGLLVFLFFAIMRQSGGGGKMSQFSKANTKTIQAGKKTTFAEVAGADEEKEELYEIVEFLKKPERFNVLGARIPKGVLLIGPPGTGKTLLARAVAGEAGVPFYSISGSDFVEMFVGVGASRVRDLFSTAKKNAPSIVFIDEIDAVGRHRGAGLGGGHDEREQTLNQLLVEMDGFGENEGVIIIAATNRRDILDPALLRPGRFDRQVIVGYPDVKGREEILKVHSRNKPLGFDVDLNKIARTTVGFTGADLENLLNESALLAARNNRKAITENDIETATIKVVAGPEKKSHKISEYDKNITAYHEAGHAICQHFCKSQDSVHEVSIIPRGMAAGYTMSLPEEDRLHMSKTRMQETLIVLLAGRVSEEIALDDVCTGASNDIERATKIARDMITKYGFSNSLGPIVYGQADNEVFLGRELNHQRNYSENVAKEIDAEIRQLIDNAYEKAREMITAHRETLELITKWLLEYEKIDSTTFLKLVNGELEFTPAPVAPKEAVAEETEEKEKEKGKKHGKDKSSEKEKDNELTSEKPEVTETDDKVGH